MGTDPGFISHDTWLELTKLTIPLWFILLSNIGIAGSLLVAHVFVPSLQASRELPDERLLRIRPLFYVTAAIFFAVTVILVFYVLSRLELLPDIYSRKWI